MVGPEDGDAPTADTETSPEEGPQALTRRTAAKAPKPKIKRGERCDAADTRNQPCLRTFGFVLIFADVGQSRSSLDRVTGMSPLAASPVMICGKARTVPWWPRCRLTIDPERTCARVRETIWAVPGSR